jgi:hypothetical protein
MKHAIRSGCVLLVVAVLCCSAPFRAASADEPSKGKDNGGKTIVAGIVTDKKEGSITVKLDGVDDPVTYTVDPDNKKTAKALAGIFTVARVRLAYETSGDAKQLVGIEKARSQATGTVTGVVLATHEWWVEVKPKNGPPDGYACSYPKPLWEATMEKIKELKQGDTVAITFFSDFERHRIQKIQKIEK